MPSPKPPDPEEDDPSAEAAPASDGDVPASQPEGSSPDDDGPTPPSAGRPKSAPGAATGGERGGHGHGHAKHGHKRKPSLSKKPEPTLLTDFFMGKPSPQRLAAQRQERERRKSLAAAAAAANNNSSGSNNNNNTTSAATKQEMKQSAVRKLQPPGGVHSRVRSWQKAHGAVMSAADPVAPPTEPSDVAFAGEDLESVTEEDRIRIRMRMQQQELELEQQKQQKQQAQKQQQQKQHQPQHPHQHQHQQKKPAPKKHHRQHHHQKPDASGGAVAAESPAQGRTGANDSAEKLHLNGAPKKRVVSDEHWLKRKGRNPQPAAAKEAAPTPLPKDFLQRTARNPTVAKKIRDWAERVEVPDPSRPPRPPPSLLSSLHGDDENHDHEGDLDDAADRSPSEEDSDVTNFQSPRSRASGASKKTAPAPAPVPAPDHDGIRVRPMVGGMYDDGIRVRPIDVEPERRSPRPMPAPRPDSRTTSASRHASSSSRPVSRTNRGQATTRPGLARDSYIGNDPDHILVVEENEHAEEEDRIEVVKEPAPASGTPTTTNKPTRRWSSRKKRPKSLPAVKKSSDPGDGAGSWVDEDESSSRASPPKAESDLTANTLNTGAINLAEIPFGFSAFSELHLPDGHDKEHPHGGASRRKPAPTPPPPNKTRRTSSFRAVPKVLGKIVSEGRKIIQETVDPPRQVANQPPSIEKWLNSTVDPFVYGATAETSNGQRKRTMEQEWVEDAHTRRKPATSPTDGGPEAAAAPAHEQQQQQHSESRGGESNKAEPRRGAEELPARSPSSPGVKRSKATRGPAPPLRTATFRMPPPLKEVFKEAFRGESNGSPYTAASYETKEIRAYESPDEGSDTEPRSPPPPPPGGDGGSGSGSGSGNSARRSSGSRSRRSESASERRTEKAESEPGPSEPSDATPVPPTQGPRRKPPTRGVHELSTILSAVSGSAVTSSAIESELSSVLSHTTITQSTGLTTKEDTATTPTTPDPMARKRSGARQPSRSRSGLRRRLTRHSDLVSVLSLPDGGDGKISRDASRRSRPSLRRVQPGSGAALDALVSEFTTDENLYQRELKTLVDGVIPVLLSEAIHSAAEGRHGQMFGDFSEYHGEDVSRAVVDMGVALEKLKNYHRRAPCGDAQRLLIWLRAVAPIYGSYLTVWRLGFHGIVVNLAPPNGEGDRDDVDEDSLLNALPRNANGDVINDEGERVDVAHFLRRPLFRVKTMAKFLKGVNAVLATDTTRSLAKQYDALHERARRRQKEELARITDLDAVKSDTTRARDLRTMSAADSVVIHPYRQVSAKDLFDFSLIHSNGQRLECQVELVHRDNQAIAGDEGDVLIREAGQGQSQAQGQTGGQIGATKSWLLFPPITIPQVSARQGTTPRDLIVMVRGSHQGRDWYELFALTADNEAQVLDWLDILGTHPVPPSELAPVTAPEPLRHSGGGAAAARRASFSPAAAADIPVGARREPEQPAIAPIPRSLPPRLHPRRSGLPPIPTISKTTPTHESYNIDQALEELDRASAAAAAAAATAKSYREDGAPPPPAHRSTGKAAATAAPHQPQHHLQPPVDLRTAGGAAGVKRRNSSPLKHEYLPSEHSERSEEDNEDDYADSLGSETGTETETETGSLSGSETEDEDEEEEDELESVGVPQTAIGISIRHDRPTAIPASLLSSCSSLTPSHSASQVGLHHTHRRQAGGPSLPATSAAAAAAADDTTGEPTPIVIRYTATVSYWYEKRGIWKELSDGPLSVAVGPGVLQVYRYGETAADGEAVLALDLTPVVLLRRSTAVDLEVRSSVQPDCRIHHRLSGGNFRFRFGTMAECINLYSAVHHARLNNQKYIQLANEARFRSFGERERPSGGSDEDQGSSGGGGGSRARRRGGGWLGRRNSYRAPSSRQQQQQDRLSSSATTPSSSSSSPSASSFLRRLAGTANLSFNLARSGVQLHRQGSIGSSGSGRPESANLSFSASASSSSAAGGHYHYNTPRSPSVSLSNGAIRGTPISPDEPIPIRLHLLVSASRWEDRGNCRLLISRPPAGWHQELRANHGLEKRITVTTAPRRKTEEPRIVLDAVLGSGCFSLMGSRGVVCGIWEGYYDMIVPPTGNPAGTVRKWCFQCSTPTIASWVLRLVHEEVLRA